MNRAAKLFLLVVLALLSGYLAAEPLAYRAPASELVVYANAPQPFTEIVRVKHDGTLVWADAHVVDAYIKNPKSPYRTLVARLWDAKACTE